MSTLSYREAMTQELLTPVQGIRRELQRVVRGYIVGDDQPPMRPTASDDSWFGPDSAAWIIHTDWATLIGGIESLLVQTLHPPTMAGVADHSDYKSDPFGRLNRTAQFIGMTIFGSAEEAQRSVDIVRTIHDRIEGHTPDGRPYRANDSENLLWVHATEVDGFLRGVQRYGSSTITPDMADQYVAEMAQVGEALGIDRAPRSVAELDATLQQYRPHLHFGSQARETIRWLAFPPNSLAAQGPYAILLSAAVAMLPAWARRKLWIPPTLPPVNRLLVEPAAKSVVRTLDWIMVPEAAA